MHSHFDTPFELLLHKDIRRMPVAFPNEHVYLHCKQCKAPLLPITMTQFYMRLDVPEAQQHKHSLVTARGFRSTTININTDSMVVQDNGPFATMQMRQVECSKCSHKVGWYFSDHNFDGTEWLRGRMAINLRKVTALDTLGDTVKIVTHLSSVMNKTRKIELTPNEKTVHTLINHHNALKAEKELKQELEKMPPLRSHLKKELEEMMQACKSMDFMFEMLNKQRVEFKDLKIKLRETYESQGENIKRLLLERRKREGTIVSKDRPKSRLRAAKVQEKSVMGQQEIGREDLSLLQMKQVTPSTFPNNPSSRPFVSPNPTNTVPQPYLTPPEQLMSFKNKARRRGY